ncbi:hypothetical protein [Ottowia sp. VDI28]|uniref:hypothetical protein n=1 Tax=Ottowia sp. VDI28 TaxID=3133968 RepID=UPI003C2AF2FA
MKKTLVAALLASFVVIGCGGGGDSDQDLDPIDSPYSTLIGTDPLVRMSFASCSAVGINTFAIDTAPRDNGIFMSFRDRSSGSVVLEATLTYQSGDNTNGFRFSGSLRDLGTGQVADVSSAVLKNNSTTSEVNLAGKIHATNRGCASDITIIEI